MVELEAALKQLASCCHPLILAGWKDRPGEWWAGKTVESYLGVCSCGCGAVTSIPCRGLWTCEPAGETVRLVPRFDSLLPWLVWFLLRQILRMKAPRRLLVTWILFSDRTWLRLNTPGPVRVRGRDLVVEGGKF